MSLPPKSSISGSPPTLGESLAELLRPTYYRPAPLWPALEHYFNAERHRFYKPHTKAERFALTDNGHRYILGKGGEGGGKTVFGIIKDLERFKRGCSGIVVSPDFEHFKRSLWPEFRRWCPWDMVHEKHRFRQAAEWEPTKPFMLNFVTGAVGWFGGIDKEMGWEGPNVNFAHFDEARRKDTPLALKVLDGRVRIPGPLGDPPQLWITTTPRKHWLFDYFGPGDPSGFGPYAAFKRDAYVFTLLTRDNAENLEEEYDRKRRQTLTEAEARVLLEAEWEDLEETSNFLPSIYLWDQLKCELPPLDTNTPIVVSLDGAVTYDNFGLVASSRHWLDNLHDTDVAFRYVEAWSADQGQINFMGTEDAPGPERRLRWLLEKFNVVQVCFDPAQLYDMSQRLGIAGEGVAWFSEFSQREERMISDKRLLDLIIQRRAHHNGDQTFRTHLENADKKEDPESRRLRIVKRHGALKIDLAVAASMSAHRCLQLNL